MKASTPENELSKYLLGNLSEEEEQALEQRFFADEGLFSELLAVEDELVDQYVEGNLKNTGFEKKLLASAEGRQKIENARALRRYITQQRKAQALPQKLELPQPQVSQSRVLIYVLAAGIIILIAVGIWLVYERSRLSQELQLAQSNQRTQQLERELVEAQSRERELQQRIKDQSGHNDQLAEELKRESERIEQLEHELSQRSPNRSSVLAVVLSPGLTRGGGTVVVLPSEIEVVKLELPLPADKTIYRTYSAALVAAGGSQVLSQKNLKSVAARTGKSLIVRVPARMLQEKTYVVTLRGERDDGTFENVEDYQFAVRRK
jgi:hypothetical protein